MLPSLAAELAAIVGDEHVSTDAALMRAFGQDALGRGRVAEVVVTPGTTADVGAIAALCDRTRTPLVVRGAGSGYTGGAVPIRGGVVLSMARFDRILSIDDANLLAVVQPNVILRDLHEAVEGRGLFYPPDPASLSQCAIGGNVAECAGGPRAFKYGTTRRYVLALEAVLPTGEVIRTGSRAVKNVAGYALTDLLVGSEGTLAVITEVTLRLVPRPEARRTLSATFATIAEASATVGALVRAGVVPAALEIVDAHSLAAVAAHVGRPLAPAGTEALLIIEVDGSAPAVAHEAVAAAHACRASGATSVQEAASAAERDAIWDTRRELSYALRRLAPRKINHDVVVPCGRVPELFALIDQLRARYQVLIACFGHAGDGNIHVNLMVDPDHAEEMARAADAERDLFAGVIALDGSITGEHGVGFAKARYLGLQLSEVEMALMARVKLAFDPHGILNPGKMWETTADDLAALDATAPVLPRG